MAKEEIFVPCTYCNAPLKAFTTDVDRLVKCPNCSKFTKVHGKAQRRMELECPVCSEKWNLSLKLRGKIHTCWKCQSQTQLLEPPHINIEEIAYVEQVEQGTEENEIIISVSNRGTPATLTSLQLAFENQSQDVSAHYEVMTSADNVSQVDHTAPVQLKCRVGVMENAPVGATTLYITIEGQDALDEAPLTCEGTIQWTIVPKRIFAIATEHENSEKASVPFGVQLWACLVSGEVDPTYEGPHYVHFDTSATNSLFNFPPTVPKTLLVEFRMGAGVCPRDFTMYNSQEKPKLMAWEEALGGPQGQSEEIQLAPGELDGFEIVLGSPQMDFAPFQGENEIHAVDKYGNLLDSFHEEVWIYPSSNIGEIFAPGLEHNIVPGNAFKGGSADLSQLQFMYVSGAKDLPREESFIVSYQEKEGSSEPITIEANPLQVTVECRDVPEKVEQGRETPYILLLQNISDEYDIGVFQVDCHFFCNSQEMDKFYETHWQNEGVECATGAETILSFITRISETAPVGTHEVECTIYFREMQEKFYGKKRVKFSWSVEPRGRVLAIISPEPSVADAGEKFALEMGVYFEGKLDKEYAGKRILHFQSNAKPSPKGTEPEIPEKLEVPFLDGTGKTEKLFCFANADENPVLEITDPAPGGARSKPTVFTLRPSALGSFSVDFHQEELVNGQMLGDLNQAFARDTYGNLKVDFAENCTISPASQRGKIYIHGRETNVIPAKSFEGGIADLGELEIAYRADVQEKLPKQEEFLIQCRDKNGKSKAITIVPSQAKIDIVRCSVPEEIGTGEEVPIYLELENIGDIHATISSVLFSFDQNGDVSSNYTLVPSSANSSSLISGVPLQLAYTVKAGAKTPVGVTQVEVKVTGVEAETQAPLQAKTNLSWRVEGGRRGFKITTGHDQREQAGVAFHLKIEAKLNDERDSRYSGERELHFESTATPSVGSKEAVIPDRLVLNFHHGEVVTPARFKLVNAAELSVIRVLDTVSKIEGQSESIEVLPGPLASFQFKIKSSVRERQPLDGRNTITAIDAYGNVIKEFDEDVEIAMRGAQGHVIDEQGRSLEDLPGDWFRNGVVNLSDHKVALVCDPEQKLPAQALIAVSCANKEFTSEPIEISPRPIKIGIAEIQTDERIIHGQSYPVYIVINNESDAKIDFETVDFSFNDGQGDHKLSFQEGDNPAQLQPGKNTMSYLIAVPETVPAGKLLAKMTIALKSREQGTMSVDGGWEWQIEIAGRTFSVATENEQQTAGVPFALRIQSMFKEQVDSTYEGVRMLSFKSSAGTSSFGQTARIPKTLKVDFRQGTAVTEQQFVLFNAQEQPVIEASENFAGGPTGTSRPVTVRPGSLDKFRWQLQSPQYNAAPFEGENTIVALDAFGNIKTDFQEDIRIQTESQKGDIQVAQAALLNMIPGHVFHEGKVDLTSLTLCYQIAQPEYLPLKERFVAVYGDKKGESDYIRIQPRPLEFKIDEVTFPKKVFQGEEERPLAISLRNSGDAAMQIADVAFRFAQEGREISSTFAAMSKEGNVSSIEPEKTSVLQYLVDVTPETEIGPVELEICVRGKLARDDKSQQTAEVTAKISFEVLEKLRDLTVTTAHDNKEVAGESFKVKIAVFKDGKEDLEYQGTHRIYFSVAGHEESRFLAYPKSEDIVFSGGVGESSQSFVLANAEQKPIITAEEREKARGNSEKIAVKHGILQSLKIVFDEKKAGINYKLQLLDKCDNVIQKDYKLDETLKPGVILSGTGGAFYEIMEIVGHGAMGKVYKGKRLNDNLIVAIKTMFFSALSDISRFLLEGHMLILLDHPNIVKGYDLRQLCSLEGSKVESKFFMVMEYLPGQSVKDLMDASPDGVLDCRYATKIVVQVARALAYMWERKIIHRDIKPDNIQITDDGRTKLIDLGIVRAEGGLVDIGITQSDTVVGSYPYIAPERLRDNTGIDYKSDVYSLGATYYHMILGMPPFLDSYKGGGGRDLLEYLVRIRTKKLPTHPQKLGKDIPKSVAEIIMTMLQLRSTKRCDTPQHLVEMLEHVNGEVNP